MLVLQWIYLTDKCSLFALLIQISLNKITKIRVSDQGSLVAVSTLNQSINTACNINAFFLHVSHKC